MFNQVLDCPKCQYRFGFDYEPGQLPENITCPSCGESSPISDYSALNFCSHCHTKLKIPLDIVSDAGIVCPNCGKDLKLDETFFDNQNESTFVPDGGRKVFRKMLQDNEFFDKYKILQLLGKGGMAEVYLAEHLLLKQFKGEPVPMPAIP